MLQANWKNRQNKVYARGDSMNGNPTASWQRLCAIERV